MSTLLIAFYVIIGLFVVYGIYELVYKLSGFGVLLQTIIYLLFSFGIYRFIKCNFYIGEFGKIFLSILWVVGYGLFGKLCDRIENRFKKKKESNI